MTWDMTNIYATFGELHSKCVINWYEGGMRDYHGYCDGERPNQQNYVCKIACHQKQQNVMAATKIVIYSSLYVRVDDVLDECASFRCRQCINDRACRMFLLVVSLHTDDL